MATETRRRNARLFEYLVARMSDAELRTMSECIQDEVEREAVEVDRRRAPHRNHSGEADKPAPAMRKQSGTRAKASGTGTDG